MSTIGTILGRNRNRRYREQSSEVRREMTLHFSWDPEKARANVRKHGVAFEEALTAFEDLEARIYPDMRHSQAEIREILLGYSARMRLLLVAFTERDGIIRIISARKATFLERLDHEQSKTN